MSIFTKAINKIFGSKDSQQKEIESLRSFFINNTSKPSSKDKLEVYENFISNDGWKDHSKVFQKLISKKELRYLFLTCKYTFFDFDEKSWFRVSSESIPSKSHFNNLDKTKEFLTKTNIFRFTNYMLNFLKIESILKFDFIRTAEFFKENPHFVESIPDVVYVLLYNIKKTIDEDKKSNKHNFKAVYEPIANLCNIVDITNLPINRYITGLKWMIVLNLNPFYASIIIKDILKHKEIDFNDSMKTLFEAERQYYSVSIKMLEIITKIDENFEADFYFQFINYVKENPNSISKTIFSFRGYILKILNCDRLFKPTVYKGRRYNYKDNSQFTNQFEINEDLVNIFIDTQETFSEGFFIAIKNTLLELNKEIKDAEDGMEYELKATYQLGKSYFIVQVKLFLKDHSNIKLKFNTYIDLKQSLPFLKEYHNMITKESIIDFLNKAEPNNDTIEAWKEMWNMQYPGEEVPDVPEWFIRQHNSTNVHNKSLIKTTDCRLKLLKENYKDNPETIDTIATDIEEITRHVAFINSKTEHSLTQEEKNEYVIKNTITTKELFNCRIDTTKPRFYGYGEIYENEKASKLPEDQRVELCRVLVEVWLVIGSTKENEEMYNTLVTQFTKMFKEHLNGGVCNQGWVGSLTAVFGTFVKELGYYCQTDLPDENEKTQVLVNKFLIDHKSDVEVSWPTIQKLFTQISGILLDAKYDDSWKEELETEIKNAKSDLERETSQKKLKSFEEKVKMYDILFEPEEDTDIKLRKETMISFLNKMKPTFFMDSYTYFNENDKNKNQEYIIDIKKAVIKAFNEFTEFQLKKIS
jgi:hypothetical protein